MHSALRELILTDIPWWSLIIRALLVYAAILAMLRLAGKRQIGQMGMAEFVALLLISNAVQNSMNGGDNSLVGGLILAITLILLATLFQYATYRSRKLEHVIQGRPSLLIHRGKILSEHLCREWLTVRELKTILRRQGIHNLDEIEQAILESDGYVSIIRKDDLHKEDEMQLVRNDVY